MKEVLKLALAELLECRSVDDNNRGRHIAIAAIKEALAQPEQEPMAWKLVPIEPTREMLEAMDECSIEGYDEHLYAGHAASVYMAAIDVAPSPPQPKEPEQKPFAWYAIEHGEADIEWNSQRPVYEGNWKPLYKIPPQRTWVGLTPQERDEINEQVYGAVPHHVAFHHAIEAKLKEKNNG